MTTDDGLKGLTDAQWSDLFDVMGEALMTTATSDSMLDYAANKTLANAARAWLAANVHDSGDGVRALVEKWREDSKYYDEHRAFVFRNCADELAAILAEKGSDNG